jgi:hypothetical protein
MVLALGGAALGLAVALLWVIANYVTKIVAALWVGRLILGAIRPAWAAGRVWPFLLGLAILVVLLAVPILGFLLNLAVILVGMGAIFLTARTTLRPAAAPAA